MHCVNLQLQAERECSALHCTTQHNTAIHCIALHFTATVVGVTTMLSSFRNSSMVYGWGSAAAIQQGNRLATGVQEAGTNEWTRENCCDQEPAGKNDHIRCFDSEFLV